MLHAATRVDGKVLWANLFLLFWLSLIPFVIRWIDETHFEALPIASYGIVLAMAAIGYHWLQQAIVAAHGGKSMLAVAVGRDVKGKLSMVLYIGAIGLSFLSQWIALCIYVTVALIWLVPDRRIEAFAKKE
jgi:TMEM175 potassium channel family protein